MPMGTLDFLNKRVVLLCGHYGSGKTNLAVNLAMEMRKRYERVAIADLDIVNPYFRSVDSKEELEAAGIEMICSQYANTNLDAPALPQEMYSIVDDPSIHVIIDVGGDERGALALGRISDRIREENSYEMISVVNCYRPLTKTADDTIEVMEEIEAACRIPFTAIINNSNLGPETDAQTLLGSAAYAEEIARKTGLVVLGTGAEEGLFTELDGKIPNLIKLNLQKKPI